MTRPNDNVGNIKISTDPLGDDFHTESESSRPSMIKVTGLCKAKDQKNQTILVGALNALTGILILPNGYKESPEDPDYIMYIRPNVHNPNKKKKPRPDLQLAHKDFNHKDV